MAYQGQPYDQNQAYGQQYQGQPYGQQSGQGQYGQPPQQGQWPQQQQQHQQHHGQGQVQGQGQVGLQGDHGNFPGGSYSITHRDTNAVLTLDIAQGSTIKSKPGAMIHMAGTVQLTGKVNFSMRKMFTGGQMAESTYAGHGKVALAPTLFGDIVTLQVDHSSQWLIGKDAYLASTADVSKETKSQGIGKALFSGEDLFIYRLIGQGIVWLTSYGAVDKIDLKPGEHYIVDNGHLVAWNTEYRIEKAGGGAMTSMKTGEGMVCRFVGPGTVYVQTRNLGEFASWVREVAGPRQ